MKAEAVRGEIMCPKCGYINKVDMAFGFVILQDDSLKKGEFRILPSK